MNQPSSDRPSQKKTPARSAQRSSHSQSLEQLENRQHMDAATVQSGSFSLDFSGDVADSVKDKSGKGTGFTRVQDNNAHDAYRPDKIDLDTAAGTLKITTVGNSLYGSSGGTDNAQTNALETQFNGSQKNFSVETRLIGPLSNLNDRYEQAGIYFGADQDNFVKLVAMRNWNGQYLCFEDEYSNGTGGVTSTRLGTNAQTSIGSFASINTLDLKIVGDASTGQMTAYWRVNSDSGAFSKVGFTIQIPLDKRQTFFNATSRAGILAAHKNDIGPITATFDSFAINPGTPVLTQPTVTGITGVVANQTEARRDPTITATVSFVPNGATSLKASTVNSTNVRLINTLTNTTIAATVSLNSAGNTITVIPSSLLDPSTQYTLQIGGGVTDNNGVALASYSIKFTTSADNTAPVLAFSKPTFYFSDVSGNSATSGAQTLKLTNVGNAPLVFGSGAFTLSGANAGDFIVTAPSTGAITVKPGESISLSIVLKASAVGLRYATLTIASNDPSSPNTTINLRGLGTAGEGGALEPSLQRILDLYQLGINTGDATPDVSNDFPATSVGPDEVNIQRFVKAGTGNVTVELLANFANSVSPSSIFGYYAAGSPQGRTKLFQVDKADAQTVTPTANGVTSFDPTGEFGIYGEFPAFPGRVVTSEKVFNTWDTNTARQQKIRFYALKDANGNVVPNAYVFAFEEYEKEFDQNDIVGIIRNVQPSALAPAIGVQNLDGVPFADRLVMSRIRDLQVPDPATYYISNTFHDQATARITNSGEQPLVVTNVTVSNGDFTILSGGGAFTLAPGATRDITVKFVFDRTGLGNEVRTAKLNIESNDPATPTRSVSLAGLWQSHSENAPNGVSMEPTVATVLSAFGYGVNVGTLNTHGNAVRAGEEVLSEYWQPANANLPVGIRQLAAYHQERSTTASNIRWFNSNGSYSAMLFKHLASDGQTLLPRNTSGGPAYGEFSPGGKFYLRVDSDYSVDSMNTNAANPAAFPTVDGGHAMRFYAAKDAAGKVIPNTYIVVMDYVGQSYSNYDYQDNIYVITGVKPASGPLAPTNLAATVSGDGNTLKWTATTEGNLAGYKVYRSTAIDGTYVSLGTTTATSFADPTASAGTTYYYRVVSFDYHGTESTTPATVTALRTVDTSPPAAPGNASAVANASSVALIWLANAESDLAGYNVYRASALDGTYVRLNSAPLTSADYTDLSAPAGQTSYYQITAVDQTGNESAAASVYAFRSAGGVAPAAPSNLAATASTSSITLTWKDNSTDETAFVVERRNADGSYTAISTLDANATSYTDGGLAAGQSFTYRVRAQNSAGISAYTATASATTVVLPPTAPGSLAAVALNAAAVRLTWSDNATNETGYRIERRLGTSGAWTTIDTIGANLVTYVDGSANGSTLYNYRVTAFNSAGTASSPVASASTPAATGLTSVDIGGPAAAGTTTAINEGRDYDIRAGGTDVWGTSDQFRYVYKQVTGDFDYSIRVAELQQADVGSMVGLMARESLDASSRHVYMRTRPNAAGGLRVNYRETTGGASSGVGNAAANYPNVYLRLQRVGNTFNAYGSADGQTWTLMLSKSMTMANTLYLGIAASARTTTTATMVAKVRDFTDRNAVNAPNPPSDLVGTTDATKASIYWTDNASNETGYRVERRAANAATWTAVATLGANATSYVDTDVTAGASYVYRVFATNDAGTSASSNELPLAMPAAPTPTVPNAPTNATATNVASGVAVAWTDASTDETSFTVERKTGSGTWTTLATNVAANSGSYTDATAAAGTTYSYRVTAINAVGSSVASNVATVTTPAAPAAPVVLTGLDIGTTGGSTTKNSDASYTVTAGGADIYGTSDQFRFDYQQLTGDFDVRVRVTAIQQVVAATMAGLMARATLDADSAQVYVKERADGTANMNYRTTTAGATTATSNAALAVTNAWLRLTRVGNTFATYTSTDGATWTQTGSVTIAMGATIYVGLATCAHQAGSTATATYDSLTWN